jgi:peptidyl-prolyl cis-trans isomerase C
VKSTQPSRTALLGALILSFASTGLQAQSAPISEQPLALQAPVDPASVCSKAECPIASRGNATITVADLGAKLNTLDTKQRDALLSDPRAFNGVIENMLITRQIANEANRAATQNDPIVKARLKLAEDEVYAVLRLDEIRATRIKGDFERLAKEHFLAHKAEYTEPQQSIVRHILIDTAKRTDAEALVEIEKLRKEVADGNQDNFARLAVERSDDPSKKQNGGMFTVAQGDPSYDPTFMEAATAITKPGTISAPVKSKFGYHLIQLLSIVPPKTAPFEDVKPRILETLQQDARRRVVSEYRSDLTAAGELKIYPENARAMIMDPEAAMKDTQAQTP